MTTIKYAYMKKAKGAAHLWDNGDTYCRMYSTGGLKKHKYQIHDSSDGRRICKMCNDVFEKFAGYRVDS